MNSRPNTRGDLKDKTDAMVCMACKEEPKSVSKIFSDFCSYTTLTGLGRVVDSTTISRKAFWILVCLGAYAMCTWHLYALFMQFFDRPTVTVLTVKHAPRMTFPSVTICNLNMIRKSKLPSYIKDKLKQLDKLNEDLANPWSSDMSASADNGNDIASSEQKNTVPESSMDSHSSQINNEDGMGKDLEINSQKNATRRRKGNVAVFGDETTAVHIDASNTSNDVSMDADDEVKGPTDMSGNIDDDVTDAIDQGISGDGGDDFMEYDETCNMDELSSDEFCDDSEMLGEEDQLETIETSILYELSEKKEEDLMAAGHQFSDFVKKCTFQGYDCRNLSRFWTVHWDYRYGNCFTFNSGRDQEGKPRRVLRTYKTGIKSGLKLNLFIEQSEYVPDLSEAAGAKVLISPQGHVPFPEDDGFYVTPGRLTAFGLQKSLIQREDPFGNGSCHEDQSLPNDNIYKKRFKATYTIQACTKHCLAEHQVKACKCAEMKFQIPNITVCDVTNKLAMNCVKKVKRQYIEGKLGCEKRCPNPCRETIIKTTSSISQWPSNSYEEKLIQDHNLKQLLNINSSNNDDALDMSRTNLLQVRVFFEQLNYEQVTEKLSYTWENLGADIGGETGLWIGVSVLTGAEVIELIYLLLCSVLCSTRREKLFWKEEARLNFPETKL